MVKLFEWYTDFDTVVKGFKNAKTNAPSVYLHFKQYKLLHGGTVHNKLFSKDGNPQTANCLFCKKCIETITHVYISENVRSLWKGNRRLGQTHSWPSF